MNMIARNLCAGAMLVISTLAQGMECGGPEMLEKLREAELNLQREKFPPAFRHALEDGGIELSMAAAAPSPQACRIRLVETLPESDVKEAAQIIERQPGRRIMLMSQGYALPENPRLEASFEVDPATLHIAHRDTLQVAELGKLRATVEMVYATLSQARAEIGDGVQNATPWPPALKKRVQEECVSRFQMADAVRSCSCRADRLEKTLGARQMEHIAYVQENPYAYATGALKGYEALVEETKRACR